MQCPNCGYISFKQEKDCGSCGHILTRAAALSASLFRNDSFTIFLSSKAAEKEQDGTCLSSSQVHDEIPVIEPSQNSWKNLEHNLDDFLLNLSDAEKDNSEATLKSDSPKLEVTNYSPMELGTNVHNNLQEVKQEMQEHNLDDFLLNLSDAEKDNSEATLKSDSPKLEVTNYSPMELGTNVYNDLQEEELELMQVPEEELVAPTTNRTKHEETQFKKLEIKNNLYKTISNKDVKFENDGKKFEATLPHSQNMEQDITEPMAPALDLGNTEIFGFEPENPAQDPASSSSQLDKLEANNSLDDTLFTEEIEKDTIEPQAPVLDLGNTEVLLGIEPESTAEDSPSPPS